MTFKDLGPSVLHYSHDTRLWDGSRDPLQAIPPEFETDPWMRWLDRKHLDDEQAASARDNKVGVRSPPIAARPGPRSRHH